MKPIYLEFNGINSFSDKAEIDFRTLLSGGVFGIFGDTGSGKSTILDCIHLALYGQIERSSGSECINHRLDSAYVVFDFEITTDGVRHTYRVRRERRRKNNTAKAWLYEYTPTGELAALAEGTRDVNERLEEIIGLTFADFKMCIALPQGDFAALVEAPTSERVKLVSRLFDLEKYGERLSKAVNEKYYNAENAVNLLLAKMEQNAGGSAENIAAKTAELAEAKERLVEQERLLKDAEKAHEQAVALDKEKREYDKTLEILRGLSLRLPEMMEKQKSAERLPLAKAVVREGLAIEKNDREKGLATMRAQDAETKIVALTKSLAQAKTQQSEAAYDEEIVKLSITLEKVLGAQADVEAEAAAKKRLEDCVAEYRRLQKECPWEDFEEKRGEIEAQLQKLGEDETLLDYMKRHFKDVLLPETYAEVREDLSGLSEKYPETAQDVALLIKKYTLEKGVEETDVSKIQIAFKAAEQERKRLKAELDGLEKRKRAYDTNEEKKKLLSEFNLHTIIRMPGSVFAPYTPITTNILFFDRTGSTKETWFYRLDMPADRKHFSKTKPMELKHFNPVMEWWNKRQEFTVDGFDKAKKFTVQQLTEELGYNLDQCGYPHIEEEILPPADLIQRYQEQRSSLNAEIDRVLADITSFLGGGQE